MTPKFGLPDISRSMVPRNKSSELASYAKAKAGILLDKFALIQFPSLTSCGSLARIETENIPVKARHPHLISQSSSNFSISLPALDGFALIPRFFMAGESDSEFYPAAFIIYG